MSQPQLVLVRPSSLGLSRLCKRYGWLSVLYPASHDCSRFGTEVDQQVSLVLSCIASGKTDDLPDDDELLVETSVVLDWLEANYPIEQWEWLVHRKVELADPETGEVLTRGTTDLICLHRTEPRFAVVDWKSKGQMWAGHLQKPDENDQQLAYLTAFWLEIAQTRKIESAKIVLACWDDKSVQPLESKDITEERLTEVIQVVRAVPPIDPTSPKPEASVGKHCDHCWQRMHCDEHLLPAAVASVAGLPAPFAEFTDQPLTAETTAKALAWLEGASKVLSEAGKIKKLVQGNVDAFVKQNGPVVVGEMAYGPQDVNGKRQGATVKTLEQKGLHRLIREGKAGVKCQWYPAASIQAPKPSARPALKIV
jgi:hypothetical protein